MRFWTSPARSTAALTPLGVALLLGGTVGLVASDRGGPVALGGLLLLAVGLLGVHLVLAARYGSLGFWGFLFNELSLALVLVLGVGLATLVFAGPLLALALVRMRPPLRLSAALLVGVWPLAAVVAGATPLVLIEAVGLLFPLPYAVLAVEALRLRE